LTSTEQEPAGGFTPVRYTQGYRPDIDGLRAVAVMLVVLGHAGVALVPGGFVGVDVFFVISGYLITTLIAAQKGAGRFTFREFYLRRAKRLLPALYVMMLAAMAAGWFILLPSDYSLLAQSALSAVALGSNYFFWRTSGGYFSPDAGSLPLLHVWSLSLEEQFYIVWPAALLLLLRVRAPRLRLGLIAAAIVASFAYAQYGVSQDWVSAYFLLESRAGEFLLGCLLALAWRDRPVRESPVAANALSGVGLALIAASAVLLHARSPFPGVAALAPCVGAVLIIAAPKFGQSLVSRALSLKPVVFVGLISYSVYLWHWPLISFLRYSRVELTPLVSAGVVAASLLLGWISWRLIETGYRASLHRPGKLPLAIAAMATAVTLAVPVAIYVQHGFPQRFPFALLTQEQLTEERGRYWRDLSARTGVFSEGEQAKQVLIVGDSHAYDLSYALMENHFAGRLKLIETFAPCYNFGHDAVQPTDTALCAERLQAVMQAPELRMADAIYLHDHWGRLDLPALTDMLRQLRAVSNAPIYVFGPKMMFSDDVLKISQEAQRAHQITASAINAYAVGYRVQEKPTMDAALKAFFQAPPVKDVHYVSWLDVQCGAELKCDILSADGQYLYFDAGHFTLLGSRGFGARLKAAHPELF
jgi:peptidoglycan/LPS O-acetylase OafA/YrhL